MRESLHAALVAMLISFLISASANAHVWYPNDCCNDRDCAVITSMTEMPNGNLRIETEHGFAFAPRGFQPKSSLDEYAHACLRQIGPDEEHMGWMLICLFLPGIA